MEDKICPASEKCPIFNDILKDMLSTTKMYRLKYCESGPAGREKCMRWLSKQKYGKAPDKLLPNSDKTLEQIGKEYFGQ